MNRRDFVAVSVALAGASGLAEAQSAAQQGGNREYYELRLLTFPTRASLDRYALFLKEAFIPAVRRTAMERAGAFTVADKPDQLNLYLLLSYPSLRAFESAETRLMADGEYRKAGASILDLPATDPPYAHAESSLMVAFESWPALKTPKETAGDQQRVFEMRTYESHSRKANKKKIEMFNKGETALFARNNFQPVFFGETLIGPQIPNLTYLLTFPRIEARDSYWNAWGNDPEKARLFANPEFIPDPVSKIHNVFLKPLPGSMI